jgi:hypothetical protein
MHGSVPHNALITVPTNSWLELIRLYNSPDTVVSDGLGASAPHVRFLAPSANSGES